MNVNGLNVLNQTPIAVYYKTLNLQNWNMENKKKTCPTVENLEPRTRNPDPSTLCRKLRDGLQNVCGSAVALHVLPQPELPNEIAVTPNEIAVTQKQADMICEKTKNQGQTDFWSKQRTGRLTGSNFYRICHHRENTNKDNILKELLNYHPLPPEKQSEQFRWGHEKENSALDLYLKKLQKKHKGLVICKSGLVVNVSWPHLGASPDGIRHCLCCAKRVVEVKVFFLNVVCPLTLLHLNMYIK